MIKKICIISLGWLGSALYKELMQTGHEVIGSYFQTPKEDLKSFQYNFNDKEIPKEVASSDILFINIPPSKIESIEHFKWFINKNNNKRILFISSTSIYGNQGEVNEEATPRPDSSNGNYLLKLENILQNNHKNFLIIRPGGLYGQDRHPGKYLAGKENIPGGLSPINLTGQRDLLNIILKNITNSKTSLVNAVNNHHPLKKDYYNAYIQKNGLPKASFLNEVDKNKIVMTVHQDLEINTPLP